MSRRLISQFAVSEGLTLQLVPQGGHLISQHLSLAGTRRDVYGRRATSNLHNRRSHSPLPELADQVSNLYGEGA